MKKYNIIATVYDKRNNVLASVGNSYKKTHPIQAKYACMVGLKEKIYLHAEIRAIIKAYKYGKPYKIKIERYTKKGKPALAKPCPICEIAIKEAGIKIVEYTTS